MVVSFCVCGTVTLKQVPDFVASLRFAVSVTQNPMAGSKSPIAVFLVPRPLLNTEVVLDYLRKL